MYRDYRIIFCIAAGRRKYLEILVKILEPYRSIVDQVQLWMNTLDFVDRNFIKTLSLHDPWFNVVRLKDDNTIIDSKILWKSVCKFYKFATDPQTIYTKIDDDIVAIDDLLHFKKYLDFRIDNPSFFLTSANVLNNAIITREHQLQGHFSIDQGLVGRYSHDMLGMCSGKFAEHIHRQILSKAITDRPNHLNFRAFDLQHSIVLDDYVRLCINWISWFGDDFAAFDGEVPVEDELWLTTVKSQELQRCTAVCATFQVVHFSFASQNKHLSLTDVLNQYKKLAGISLTA